MIHRIDDLERLTADFAYGMTPADEYKLLKRERLLIESRDMAWDLWHLITQAERDELMALWRAKRGRG